MARWRRGVVLACALAFLAACSGSASAPSPPAAGGAWKGTDLLWDAIGDAHGFTAVGNSGVVVTSSDGKSWIQQQRSTEETLRGIASGGGSVVAVGTGGTVVSWPAGEPGAAAVHPTGADVTLLGAAYGHGTWVVGGSGGSIFTATDLTRWTRRVSQSDGDIFAMAYGDGRFVAVTDIGGILTSPDGITWTSTRAPDGLWLWGIAYGADGFVATGANGTVLQSTNGQTWLARTSGTTQVLRGVTFGRGQYLAVGSDAAVVSSPDGTTWTAHNVGTTGVELWRPASTGSTWLAVGAGGTRLVSPNLTSWTGGHTTRTAFYGVGVSGPTVLASGVNGTIARRGPDGTWTSVATAPRDRELRSVTRLASTWVATGGGGTIMTSTNGTTFEPRVSGSIAELWSAAAIPVGAKAAAPRLVVVGAGGTILVSDDSGQTWRSVPDPQKATLFSVAAGTSGLVAVGVDGATIRSADGLTWVTVPTGFTQTLRAVAAGGKAYVAVGASGTVLTSTDAVTWRIEPPATTLTLRAVADVGGIWNAVGGGGVAIRSADRRHWDVIASGSDSELFALTKTTGCGAIAVAGVDASIITKDCGSSWSLTR